jgi:hypothetical protein
MLREILPQELRKMATFPSRRPVSGVSSPVRCALPAAILVFLRLPEVLRPPVLLAAD